MKQILIVEDDISLSNGIALALKNHDFEMTIVHNLAYFYLYKWF